jgi:hypothetical protein
MNKFIFYLFLSIFIIEINSKLSKFYKNCRGKFNCAKKGKKKKFKKLKKIKKKLFLKDFYEEKSDFLFVKNDPYVSIWERQDLITRTMCKRNNDHQQRIIEGISAILSLYYSYLPGTENYFHINTSGFKI